MSDGAKLMLCGFASATIIAPIDAVLAHWWQLSDPQAVALFAVEGLLISLVYPLAYIAASLRFDRERPERRP